MRLVASSLISAPPRQYDVCIIGSGPAGISLAHSLFGTSIAVCVIESGDAAKTDRADALRAIESEGIAIRNDSRERVFGGTSTTWAGLSSPFDPIDFVDRPWVPYSGWPIELSKLIPFYQRASARFRFPHWDHFGTLDWLPAVSARVPRWRDLDAKTFLAADPPQNFGAEFGHVFDGTGVDLIQGATVTEIRGQGGTSTATGVTFHVVGGASGTIGARVVVLAAGGIENARLLLASRFGCAVGLGNDRDQVGRYFMNHPKATYGVIELAAAQGPLPGYFGFLYPGLGYAGYMGLRLASAEQARLGVLNSYVRFEPVFDWSDNPGVDALVRVTKRRDSFMQMFRRFNRDDVVALRSYAETGDDPEPRIGAEERASSPLRDMLSNPIAVLRYVRARLTRGREPLVTSVRLRNFMEMAPDPENRITLSDRTDALGSRHARVVHRCGELDRRSVVALHRVLGEELARSGWGRLQSDLDENQNPWPIDSDASHHLGATRMGVDPATSVVNADLRLHTADSVYVVGGSVFPTSGCVNPTYTIVALALRLGDHLRQRFGVA